MYSCVQNNGPWYRIVSSIESFTICNTGAIESVTNCNTGAIHMSYSSEGNFIGNVSFEGNYANDSGGEGKFLKMLLQQFQREPRRPETRERLG